MKNTIGTTYRELLYEIVYPLVASAAMFAGVWVVHLQLDVHPLLKFVLLILTGTVTYVASVFVLEVQFDWGIRQNVDYFVTNVKN
jgi:PST family polysaccharide transporter/lipopolysaccharide exporter